MGLLLAHPAVAMRDCGHCQKFQYNEETGEVVLHRGQPLRRPKRIGPPCRQPQGCPKGTPESPKELSEKNWMAYLYYLECRAVNSFPDDPIVRRNARLIRVIEDRIETARGEVNARVAASMMRVGRI